MPVARYIVLGVFLIAGVTLFVFASRRTQAIQKAWAAYARERGYAVAPMQVKGVWNGVAFTIDTTAGSRGSKVMRISAKGSAASSAVVDIRQRDRLAPAPSELQVVRVDDAELERAYIVATDNPAFVQALLTPVVRSELVELGARAPSTGAIRVAYRAGQVEAIWALEERAEALDAGVRLVTAMARVASC
ncbi:MAG: hypothetical protein U0271_28655 [Polyangiaceae bacterium]